MLIHILDWKTLHCALKYQRQILHCVVDLCNMNLQLHCSTAEILYIRGPEGSTDQAYSFSILLKQGPNFVGSAVTVGNVYEKTRPSH